MPITGTEVSIDRTRSLVFFGACYLSVKSAENFCKLLNNAKSRVTPDLTRCTGGWESIRESSNCVIMNCHDFETAYCGRESNDFEKTWKKTDGFGIQTFLAPLLIKSTIKIMDDEVWYGHHQNEAFIKVDKEKYRRPELGRWIGTGYKFERLEQLAALFDGKKQGYVEGTTTVTEGGEVLQQYATTVALQKRLPAVPIGAYFSLDPQTTKKEHCEVYSTENIENKDLWHTENGFLGTAKGRKYLFEYFKTLVAESKTNVFLQSKLFMLFDDVNGQIKNQKKNVIKFFELFKKKNILVTVVATDFNNCRELQTTLDNKFPCLMEHGDMSQAFVKKPQKPMDRVVKIKEACGQGLPHLYAAWPVTYANQIIDGGPADAKFYKPAQSFFENTLKTIRQTRDEEVIYFKRNDD